MRSARRRTRATRGRRHKRLPDLKRRGACAHPSCAGVCYACVHGAPVPVDLTANRVPPYIVTGAKSFRVGELMPRYVQSASEGGTWERAALWLRAGASAGVSASARITEGAAEPRGDGIQTMWPLRLELVGRMSASVVGAVRGCLKGFRIARRA